MLSLWSNLKYTLYRLQFNHPALFNHKPIHLDLELVRACNLKCSYCYRQEPMFAKHFPDKYKKIDDAKKVLKQFYDNGFRSVKFNWRGEPLLHGGLGYLAKYANNLGYLDIMINTNLALPNISDDFWMNVNYFTQIRVSIDSVHAQVFERMRAGASLEVVMNNLKKLYLLSHTAKIIIQRRTNEDTEADDVFIKTLQYIVGRKINLISKPIQPRTNKYWVKSYFEAWQKGTIKRKYCKQPSRRIVYGVDDKVHLCCMNYKNDICLLADLELNNKFYTKIRNFFIKQIKDNNSHNASDWPCETCFKCTSFEAYR
jgi:wyosine [tRNA(Phe)-imidazoG37] synthetase (radical SAM superfamily)